MCKRSVIWNVYKIERQPSGVRVIYTWDGCAGKLISKHSSLPLRGLESVEEPRKMIPPLLF
jgi:hypothetical protein